MNNLKIFLAKTTRALAIVKIALAKMTFFVSIVSVFFFAIFLTMTAMMMLMFVWALLIAAITTDMSPLIYATKGVIGSVVYAAITGCMAKGFGYVSGALERPHLTTT